MAKPTEALDYLAKPAKHPAAAVTVMFGDEAFLKRQVLGSLKDQVLAGDDAEFSVSVFKGSETALRDVFDALATRALFGGGKHLVVVDDADDFVSQNRSALEDYVAKPKSSSILVLDVKLWPATTRLYKSLAENGLQIECKMPTPAKTAKWIIARARDEHQVTLDSAAAELILERVEPDLGLVNQELAKLAALAGLNGTINVAMVQQAVGGWRAQTAWDMLDAALAGEARTALLNLDRLLVSGEVPIALLAQIAASLRRLGAAARLIEDAQAAGRRMPLRQALEEAGIKSFFAGKAEAQMRHLGRARAGKLYRWLLEADLALKGSSSSPARSRLVLEELIVRLAAVDASPARAGS